MAISTTHRIQIEQALRNDLCRYLCDQVWNLPLQELRRNIVLRAVSKGLSCRGFADLGARYIDLPAGELGNREYYVYAAACCCMGGLVVDTTQSDLDAIRDDHGWMRLDQYLNLRPFDLRIHGVHGEWLHRHHIFIRNHPYEDMFLLAIDSQMADQCLGGDYHFSTVYMSVYYDSDNNQEHLRETSVYITSFHPTTQEQCNSAYQAWRSCDQDKSFCFVNGRESTPEVLRDIQRGDYVELVEDSDIIANLIFDLVDTDRGQMYPSTIDGTLKRLIHIPKEVNPDNRIITHNTCDIYIRPVNTADFHDARMKGLFVHRFNTSLKEYDYIVNEDSIFHRAWHYYTKDLTTGEYHEYIVPPEQYGIGNRPYGIFYVRSTQHLSDYHITQITHNDFGVSTKILQPYMEHIHSTEYNLRVVVRHHSKARYLDRDCNFIKLLYQFDDATIKQFLAGNPDGYCQFWSAEMLEASQWAKMLFDVPTEIVPANTKHYLDALGYYNAMSVTTPRVVAGGFDSLNTRCLEFSLPHSLQLSNALDTLFSLNGSVLTPDQYQVSRNYQYLQVTVNNDVQLRPGDKLVAEIFERHQPRANIITPTSSNNTFVIPGSLSDEPIEIYEITRNPVVASNYYTDHYLNQTNLVGYHKRELDEVTTNDVVDYTTKTIQLECVVAGCTEHTHIKTVDVAVAAKRTLTFGSNVYNKELLIISRDVYGRWNSTDAAQSGGNATIKNIQGDSDLCSDLLHSGKLTLSCKSWTNDDYIEVPIISRDWTVLAVCNGRELVEGIDYSRIVHYDEAGNVLYHELVYSVNAQAYEQVSYLNRGVNNFDVICTTDPTFINCYGFIQAAARYLSDPTNPDIDKFLVTEDVSAIYWFDLLCKLSFSGHSVHTVDYENGHLATRGDYANGELYLMRGTVPVQAVDFFSQYGNDAGDVAKLAEILRYIRSLETSGNQTMDIIPRSHHITSVTMNCLVKDVMTGETQLSWYMADNELAVALQKYESMKRYDPVFMGATTSITVEGAGIALANAIYRLDDISQVGNQRTWTSSNHAVVLVCNQETNQWELRTKTIYGDKVLYASETMQQPHDPWECGWRKVDGRPNVPKFYHGGCDMRYVDIFPSYTSDEHVVVNDMLLRKCMAILMPSDATKDGATPL